LSIIEIQPFFIIKLRREDGALPSNSSIIATLRAKIGFTSIQEEIIMPIFNFQHPAFRQITLAMAALATSILFVSVIIAVAPNSVQSSSQEIQSSNQLNISLVPFAANLNDPVGIANAGDNRIFVLERDGIIRIVRPDGTVKATPFLDITARVDSSHTEKGLLGLAFDPNYATNGHFYVNYTSDGGDFDHTRISRFQVSNNPDIADPNSEEILITVGQPYPNHNAGAIMFGPDGYLYITLGDGGDREDPENRAQTMTTLLGKVSRIDVGPETSNGSLRGKPSECAGSGIGNYSIPIDNPFANGSGGPCDEIWALGLRNPWQSSFDRLTGDFFIGDVGQYKWEEIDHQPALSNGGENYGWRCYEGNHPFKTSDCSPPNNYVFPVFEYSHDFGDNCAVVAGYVYRGEKYPEMSSLIVAIIGLGSAMTMKNVLDIPLLGREVMEKYIWPTESTELYIPSPKILMFHRFH
jgi:glucose/arabinose dehydrogenase